MEGFLLGVLAASFLGSLHCVGMCGALVGIADGRSASGHALYQAGRLATLLVLGALAGAIGVGVDALGELAGLQRAVATATGVLVILWGVTGVFRGAGWHVPAPAFLTRATSRAFALLQQAPKWRRALLVGLLTPFLPCGWLALFVIAAAGTGQPGWGAVTLAVFWAGNLPALLGVGLGLHALLRKAPRKALPAISGVVLVLLGVLLLTQRATLAAPLASPTAPVPTVEDQDQLPCCDGSS